MAEDRIWPDDYTFGWGSMPAPRPVAATRDDLLKFEARRWCIEQLVAVRLKAPSDKPLHEDAAALFAFLVGTAPA